MDNNATQILEGDPLFLKGVEYAHIQHAVQQASIGFFCLWIILGFILASLIIVFFFWWRGTGKTKDSLDGLTNKYYLIFALLTFYTIFAGAFFGKCSFYYIYFVPLIIPAYTCYCYYFDVEGAAVISISVDKIVLVVYCSILFSSFFLSILTMQAQTLVLFQLALAEKRIFFGDIDSNQVAVSGLISPSPLEPTYPTFIIPSPQEGTSQSAADPVSGRTSSNGAAVPVITGEVLEQAGSPHKRVEWQSQNRGVWGAVAERCFESYLSPLFDEDRPESRAWVRAALGAPQGSTVEPKSVLGGSLNEIGGDKDNYTYVEFKTKVINPRNGEEEEVTVKCVETKSLVGGLWLRGVVDDTIGKAVESLPGGSEGVLKGFSDNAANTAARIGVGLGLKFNPLGVEEACAICRADGELLTQQEAPDLRIIPRQDLHEVADRIDLARQASAIETQTSPKASVGVFHGMLNYVFRTEPLDSQPPSPDTRFSSN